MVWDDGNVRTSYTTLPTSALAVVRCLERSEETANKYLLVAEVTATQNEIVAVLEKVEGAKYEVEHKSTEEANLKARELWKNAFKEWEEKGGEEGTGIAQPFDAQALQLGFAVVMYGPDRESDWLETNSNELLGIQTQELEPIVRNILQKYPVKTSIQEEIWNVAIESKLKTTKI